MKQISINAVFTEPRLTYLLETKIRGLYTIKGLMLKGPERRIYFELYDPITQLY